MPFVCEEDRRADGYGKVCGDGGTVPQESVLDKRAPRVAEDL